MIPWQLITTLPVLSLWKLVRNSTSLSLFLTRISWIGGVLLGFATNTCGKNNITTEIYGIEKILLSHLIKKKHSHLKPKTQKQTMKKKTKTKQEKLTVQFNGWCAGLDGEVCVFNPFHPNISIHILHTAICTFTKVLTRRICLPIKSFLSWWSLKG